MKRETFLIFGIVLLLLSNGCVSLNEIGVSPVPSTKQDGFTIDLPARMGLERRTPVEDFVIYRLVVRKKAVGFIYVGNNPDYPKLKNLPSASQTTMLCGTFRCSSFWKESELVGREILIDLGKSNHWGGILHAWTAKVSKKNLAIAERALFSIKTEVGSAAQKIEE